MPTSHPTFGRATPGAELTDQAARRATRIADWLDQRDRGSLLDEVAGGNPDVTGTPR